MASSKEYLDFVLEQLSGLEGLSYRPMMGEFILYLDAKIVGGIYDDRLLVKPTPFSLAIEPKMSLESPYDGAKDMLLVDRPEDGVFLKDLLVHIAAELPQKKRK